MSKFSKTPGVKNNRQQSVDEFIAAANKLPESYAPYPWEDLDDARRRTVFNIRLTDAEIAKLKFISENTPHSMHEFCISIVAPAIEAKIVELTKEKRQ